MPIKRFEITDSQWKRIKNLFPIAKTGRPAKDNRMVFNAILWIARSGSAWRDLPERYGSWKTVYSRFCKWRDNGTLLLVFECLNAEADYANLCIDTAPHRYSSREKEKQNQESNQQSV